MNPIVKYDRSSMTTYNSRVTYYKSFHKKNLSCIGSRFEVGKEYSIDGELEMCKNGFHCCRNMLNCLEYYKSDSRFCEVLIGEESITEKGKTVTSTIRILRELGREEIEKLLTGEVKFSNGNWESYKNGKRHSENDLPAVVYHEGSKAWYKDGKLHRENDLPALEYAVEGYKAWYKNGKQHRDGGLPAVEYANGRREWWKNGKLHRKNGMPAIQHANGSKELWNNGYRYK